MPSENYPFLNATPDALGQLQHFRVEKLIGEGGMGYVFEAIDTRLQRPVALKVLKPEGMSRNLGQEHFLHEAQAIASIRHPNVVTIYHIDSENG
ncbi:MAG: protein kinase, partial [Planctomycetota bacterium]